MAKKNLRANMDRLVGLWMSTNRNCLFFFFFFFGARNIRYPDIHFSGRLSQLTHE